MAGCVGEPKGSPVSVPGYANPAQFATSSIGVVGGDNFQMYGVIVMTTQISVETLSPITHNQIPVITTELLAQLYGTEPVRIRQNHHENKVRFVEGKHFFKVVGNDLKELRVALNYSQNPISPKPAPSSSGQNAEQPVMPKCWKPIRRGMCSKNWKTAISDKRIRQRQFHARKVTTREFSVISEAVSLFPQFSYGMMILLFPLSHGWNWREPMVGLLFAEINWWKG